MKRLIGLDYGGKNIGVAVSDPLGWTARGLTVLRRDDEQSYRPVVKRISELLKEYETETIVLGYPKNMDNSEGKSCQKVLKFKEQLEKSIDGVKVILQDERMSTMGAMHGLNEAGLSFGKKNLVIDKLAAAFILQGYLDKVNKKETTEMNKDEFDGLDDFDEEEVEIVTLTNDDGEEIECEILDSIEYNGTEYLLVIETEDDEDGEEEGEAMPFILKSVAEDDESYTFESITDDKEFEKVLELFNELSDDYELE